MSLEAQCELACAPSPKSRDRPTHLLELVLGLPFLTGSEQNSVAGSLNICTGDVKYEYYGFSGCSSRCVSLWRGGAYSALGGKRQLALQM